MAFRTIISSRLPMVIILGATGTGKTKLGVELAQRFGTEIISADSMQIYKGLDVVTAKATLQERELVPHHLLDILEPHQMFTVVDFRSRALKIIDDLTSQGKIPIIVGGTNYYIESIVYQILVETSDDTEHLLWDRSHRKRDIDSLGDESKPYKVSKTSDSDNEGDNTKRVNDSKSTETDNARDAELNKDSKESTIVETIAKSDTEVIGEASKEIDRDQLQNDVDNEKKFTNEEIHAKLEAIDPEMAKRLHPNNRRKVLRSIEIWLKTGRRQSEVLEEQSTSEGLLRRPGETIIFWLKCEQKVHDERLDSRVDAMLKDGLIQELLDFHDRHNKHRIHEGELPDYTKGVFQTLGFKEFHEYLMLSEEAKFSESGVKLLELSIENMKIGTRRYARRQNKMVKGRFLEHPRREVPPIYELDTTDVSKWDEEVKNKAINIVESYLYGVESEYQPIKPERDEGKKKLNVASDNYCDICNRLIIGDREYAIHLTSNRHKKVLKKKNAEANKKKKLEETVNLDK